jgi:hypothetical protein
VVAHAYEPGYSGDGSRKMEVQVNLGKIERLKNKLKTNRWGMAQVIEHLQKNKPNQPNKNPRVGTSGRGAGIRKGQRRAKMMGVVCIHV